MVGAIQGRKLGVKLTELAVEGALLIGRKKLLVGSPVRLRVGGQTRPGERAKGDT